MSRITQRLSAVAAPLTEQHIGLVQEYLRKTPRLLSAFHISQVYMWQVRFGLWHAFINGRLCILFSQEQGCFMFLPPLGEAPDRTTVMSCFELMDQVNEDAPLSRIENVPQETAQEWRAWGFDARERSPEYVYERRRLAALPGNALKAKRAALNQFQRRYAPEYRAYTPGDEPACQELLQLWSARRRDSRDDQLYRYLLEDTSAAQELTLKSATRWGLTGRVLVAGDRIVGYTFGYPLNDQTWCVLFETCDPSYNGSAAYLFREFCAQMKEYLWINCLDDSGLENVQRAKQSYRPQTLLPVYAMAGGTAGPGENS